MVIGSGRWRRRSGWGVVVVAVTWCVSGAGCAPIPTDYSETGALGEVDAGTDGGVAEDAGGSVVPAAQHQPALDRSRVRQGHLVGEGPSQYDDQEGGRPLP